MVVQYKLNLSQKKIEFKWYLVIFAMSKPQTL